MKFRQDMLFGHPVLIQESDDYGSGSFQMVFANPVVEVPDLVIRVKPELKSPDLRKLIDQGKAVCGFYIICEDTFYNRFYPTGTEEGEFRLEAHDFSGAVRLRGVVVSKGMIQDFSSEVLNPEFGDRTNLPAASILALDGEQKFAVGQISKKPFESIFSLVENSTLIPGKIVVDTGTDKIQIGVHPLTKANIDEFRLTEAGKIILLNSVYMPAVMELLHQISGNLETVEDRPWFPVFSAKCAVAGINMDDPNPLADAQKLLSDPFTRLEDKTIKERLLA